jgi:DNA-binding NarL/FixJ family response regulator
MGDKRRANNPDEHPVNEDTRQEILARYRRHAARFARDAASRNRLHVVEEASDSPDPPAPPAIMKSQLSGREQQILELIASGLTDAEIAKRVTLSEFTVKTHVKRLLTKLGARNRAHAVALGAHRGLLALTA